VFGLLVVLFFVLPIAELAVIVQVSDVIGLGNTIGLLILLSVAGAWLVKQEGLGVARRVQDQLQRGEMPGREVIDGFLILLGGALMLTPGFLTDVVGLFLLLPPARAVVRAVLARRWFRDRVVTTTYHTVDVPSYEEPSRQPGQLDR
jgi:UPF0716 protein FxsA